MTAILTLTVFWLAASAAYVYMAWSANGRRAGMQMIACCAACYVALVAIQAV